VKEERPATKRVKTKGKQKEEEMEQDGRTMGDDDEEEAKLWSHFDDSDWDWSTIFGYWP
jgi:hypothetical protein